MGEDGLQAHSTGGGQVAMGYSLRSSQRRVGEEIAGVGVWGTALSPLFC